MEDLIRFEDLAAEAPVPPRGIHSQTLSDSNGVTLVLFAFAPRAELSEHSSARPVIVHLLRGEADITVGQDRSNGHAGTRFRMSPGTPHSILAHDALVLALYLLPLPS